MQVEIQMQVQMQVQVQMLPMTARGREVSGSPESTVVQVVQLEVVQGVHMVAGVAEGGERGPTRLLVRVVEITLITVITVTIGVVEEGAGELGNAMCQRLVVRPTARARGRCRLIWIF